MKRFKRKKDIGNIKRKTAKSSSRLLKDSIRTKRKSRKKKHKKMISKAIQAKLESENYSELSTKELKTIIKAADAFFHDSDPSGLEIDDETYDTLYDLLKELDPKSSALKKIGHPVQSGAKEQLQVHLGSQQKLKDDSAIQRHLKTFPGKYIVSDKMDGVSLMVSSSGAFTRGDGDIGRNITPLYDIMEKNGKVPPLPTGDAIIRGELIISDEAYQKLSKKFDKTSSKSSEKFPKNKRSFAAGLSNSKTLNEDYIKELDFIAYEVIQPKMKISKQMKWLEKHGYNVVWYGKMKESDVNAVNLSQILQDRKQFQAENNAYEMDGIVVVNDNEHDHPTKGNPAYSFAFKTLHSSQLAPSTVLDVQWSATKHGVLAPLVIIKPIDIGGITISKVNGKNARYIVDNEIGPGAKVIIERSGDVIPNIHKTIKGAKLKLPDIPHHWDKKSTTDRVHFMADKGAAKDEIAMSLLENFFDKMKADGFGPGIVAKLFEAGYEHPGHVLAMGVEDFEALDGIASKSAAKLHSSIHESIAKATPDVWVAASGAIPGFGKTRIKAILKDIPDLLSNKKRSADTLYNDLVAVDGLAEKMARQFVDNMQNFNTFMEQIPSKITKKVKLSASPTSKAKAASKGNVVLSGTRDKDVVAHLESKGYELTNSVKADTLYLIVADKSSTSSKVTAAEKKNIPIIDLVAAMKL